MANKFITVNAEYADCGYWEQRQTIISVNEISYITIEENGFVSITLKSGRRFFAKHDFYKLEGMLCVV